MRVAIDAIPLLIRSAGVKNYLYYWIDHLRRLAGTDAIRTFPSMPHLGPLRHDGSIAPGWTTLKGLASLAAANYSPAPILDWSSRGANVFHATNLVRHPPQRVRLTATIHDMTSWLLPELHPSANIRADQNFVELMRRADGLIAVSASTKNDAVRLAGIAPEKVTVIHSGIPAAFFEPAGVEDVRKRYRLTRPFVLFIGTIEPRKNLDILFDAYGALPDTVRREFELVIAGPIGWASAATRARLQEFRHLGYLPEADIAPLTAAATVFAYPSLYEGFGFPVVQAMAAGAPVVTSNVSSLPEVTGDAAVLVDPRSSSELRDALCRMLLSPELRADLAARGRARAEAFRWEKCAAESLRFFERIAG